MKNHLLLFSTGFALFSMFFGSGNLVFPITVGYESEGHYLLAALGIFLTGVVVPFSGVFGMMLYEGNLKTFFKVFGKKGLFIFSFLALALMGPFGVLARCLTVAHGAVLLLVPTASLPATSAGLCGVIFLLTYHKNKIVSLLGSVLTPFLLVAIGAIVCCGVAQGSCGAQASELQGLKAFKNGFFQGYQTMDLLAAFFFSQFIIRHLTKTSPHGMDKAMLKLFFNASMIGGGLLAAVYFALVLLGWIYAPMLLHTAPEEMLGIIAMESLGAMAAPCVCLAIIFACLTTAIVLTALFADFLRKDVSKDKLPNSVAIFITLAIGFGVSTLEFSGIAKFLGPLLEAIYPVLIALTLINIGCHFYKARQGAPLTLPIENL